MSCESQDFEIKQGETLSLPFFWYDGDPVVVAISAVALGYPPVLTATAHGLPGNKTPAQIVSVGGATDLNTDDGETVYAFALTSNTFSLPDINAAGMPSYTSGGFLVYRAPKNLTGYTARLQIRPAVNSATVLFEMTSANGDIVLGGTEGSATLTLTATQTSALTFSSGVYQLELVSAGAVVKRLAGGVVTLSKEVTR